MHSEEKDSSGSFHQSINSLIHQSINWTERSAGEGQKSALLQIFWMKDENSPLGLWSLEANPRTSEE